MHERIPIYANGFTPAPRLCDAIKQPRSAPPPPHTHTQPFGPLVPPRTHSIHIPPPLCLSQLEDQGARYFHFRKQRAELNWQQVHAVDLDEVIALSLIHI